MYLDEAQIKYLRSKACNKYKPRSCFDCPLERYRGKCNIGVMINELKDYAESNVTKDALEARRMKW